MNTTKIKDVCVVVSGTTPKSTEKRYWNGTHVWITPAELTEDSFIVSDSERHITDEAVKATGLKPFPKGTVLLSSRAPIGKVAIAGCDMYCNQGFKNLICSESIYNLYLYYFLKSKTEYLNSLGRGATFKEISKGIVEDINIPFPAYDEQIHIAKQLQKITELIALKRRQYRYLDDIIRSRFIEMFGDPSKLNNFANAQIKDVASVGVGIVIKPTRFYSNDKSGKRAFRSLNIGPFGINPNSEWVYFTNEAMVENKRTIVHEGDVLIVRSGNPGTSCVVSKEYDGCNVIDLIIARPDKSKILPEYLCAFTNMPHGMNQINNQKHGVAQRHFNVSMYEKMKIYIPNLSLQQQYVNFMKQVDKSKMAVQKSLDELETLKKSLMQTYFG